MSSSGKSDKEKPIVLHEPNSDNKQKSTARFLEEGAQGSETKIIEETSSGAQKFISRYEYENALNDKPFLHRKP